MDSIQQVKWDIWRRDHYFKEGQEAHDAFELAITEGLLSRLESAPNYSGDYMLMQTRIIDNVDFFKRKDTREYIRNEHDHDVNQEIFRESQRRKIEKVCYKCGMDNGSTPCTNCGYSGELVLRKDRQPLMPHNQVNLYL